MDTITLPDANQFYLVIGGQAAASRLLELAARLALSSLDPRKNCGSLLILDCGNRANPLPLVRELRRLTADPVRVLRHIQIARAFTCYQVLALLEDAAARPVVPALKSPPVLIFDLLATFYDESVSYREGLRLLESTLGCLTRLRPAAPVLVSTRPPLADFPERKTFLERLCQLSDRYWLEAAPQVAQLQQPAFAF